ncbi:uncharacterized protein DAT39_021481, partial [Clarias magur]
SDSPAVSFMLTVLFGAVIVILFSVLIFIILKHKGFKSVPPKPFSCEPTCRLPLNLPFGGVSFGHGYYTDSACLLGGTVDNIGAEAEIVDIEEAAHAVKVLGRVKVTDTQLHAGTGSWDYIDMSPVKQLSHKELLEAQSSDPVIGKVWQQLKR